MRAGETCHLPKVADPAEVVFFFLFFLNSGYAKESQEKVEGKQHSTARINHYFDLDI